MSSIGILPPEVLLEIFEYLSPEELLNNVQQVCTSWRELVQHPSLWEDFVYSPTKITYLNAIKFIEKCPMLKHIDVNLLDLDCLEGPEGVVNAVIKNCLDMRTFCVNFVYQNCFTLSHINSLFEAFPNLETFGITIDCPEAIQIVNRVSKSTKLKKLIVRGTSYIDGMFQPLIDGCSSLNSLCIEHAILLEKQQLWILQNMKDRLSHVQFILAQPATPQVIRVLSTFTKLEELKLIHHTQRKLLNFLPLANVRTLRRFAFYSLAHNMIDVDTLFDALFCNPFPLLQELTIAISSYDGVRAVVKDICMCYPNMRSVFLWYTLSGNKKDNFEEMGRLQKLERFIYHASSSITDDDTEHIARCRTLKHLDLSYCTRLTDKTVANLVNCNLLESLYLNYLNDCSLSEQCLDVFLEHCMKLNYLVVNGINVRGKKNGVHLPKSLYYW